MAELARHGFRITYPVPEYGLLDEQGEPVISFVENSRPCQTGRDGVVHIIKADRREAHAS